MKAKAYVLAFFIFKPNGCSQLFIATIDQLH